MNLYGKDSKHAFSASVNRIARLCVFTKEMWQIPYADINTVGKYGKKEQILTGSEEPVEQTVVHIHALIAK